MLDVARQRLKSQRLVGEPLDAPARVVEWLGAVQAQDYAGSKWALGLRCKNGTDAAVEAAFQAGRFVRTHVLRPTWHFVPPRDVRWMLALTAPRIRAAMRYYDHRLDIDAPLLRRAQRTLEKALAGGRHLTRTELAGVLARAKIVASGQRLGHILMHAELDALIGSGPRRGKQFTYALLDERFPEARRLDRDAALAELSRRYFTSHGPARLVDFAWWSGLTLADSRRAVEDAGRHLVCEAVDGKEYWLARDPRTARFREPVVHLLPNYDECLVAYKDHSATVEPALMKGIGREAPVVANHLIVQNGRLLGGWRRLLEKKTVVVEATTLRRLDPVELAAVDTAAHRFSSFLEQAVQVRLKPLARRPAR